MLTLSEFHLLPPLEMPGFHVFVMTDEEVRIPLGVTYSPVSPALMEFLLLSSDWGGGGVEGDKPQHVAG